MPPKQGKLSRADLLSLITSQSDLKAESGVMEYLVEALVMQPQPKKAATDTIGARNNDDKGRVPSQDTGQQIPSETNHLTNHSPTKDLKAQYWQLLKQTNREDEDNDEDKKQITQRPVWYNRPEKRPAFPALMSEEAIQQRLLPKLRQDKATHSVDIEKLIDQVSRAEFVTELPRLHLNRDIQALQIIDDRQVHLIPYWLDHSWLTWHVRDSMAEYRFSHAVIEQGEIQPQSIEQQTLIDYQVPPEGSTILLLSDLGVLNGSAHRYQVFLDQLIVQGYHLVVVTPCHIKDYPADIASKITLVSWEEHCRELPVPQAKKTTVTTNPHSETKDIEITTQASLCPRQEWAETLLRLCSTTVRLEPELLRSVRYALNKHRLKVGEQLLPASAESLAWQHPAVSQKHSVAATVDSSENKRWKTQLKDLPRELKQAVFDTQRHWRNKESGLPDEIWFEELASIDHCCGGKVKCDLSWFSDDIQDAGDFLQYQSVLCADSTHLEAKQIMAWLYRVDTRLSDEAIIKGRLKKPLQHCLLPLSDESGVTPAGHALDPSMQKSKETVTEAYLCHWKGKLTVMQLAPFDNGLLKAVSVISMIRYRSSQLSFSYSGVTHRFNLPKKLEVGDSHELSDIKAITGEQVLIKTDISDLNLELIERPSWADTFGQDFAGLYADVNLDGSYIRFRYFIPQASKMVGMPFWLSERNTPLSLLGSFKLKTKQEALQIMVANQQTVVPSRVASEYAGRLGAFSLNYVAIVADKTQLAVAEQSLVFNSRFSELQRPAPPNEATFRVALVSRQEDSKRYAVGGSCQLMKLSWADYLERLSEDESLKLKRLPLLKEVFGFFSKHRSFEEMEQLERKWVAGFTTKNQEDWGLFGHMKGAGKFHSLINNNDINISKALDEIPLTGDLRYEHYRRFLEYFSRAFVDADMDGGGGISGATRLLAMKRPDYFVAITSANRGRLAESLNIKPYRLYGKDALKNYWSNVVVPIIYSDWWGKAPENNNDYVQKIWNARAALLDVIHYEE